MTIPVIPGPFSFLASAGQAAGAIGTEITNVRDRKRKEAQQNVQNLLAMIDSGRVNPQVLNRPEVIDQFQQAGIPIPKPANIHTSVPGIAMNTPVDVQTQPPFTESADDITRRITSDYLKTVKPGTPQAAAVAKVPTAPTAMAGERTAVAGASTAESGAVTAGEQARAAPSAAEAEIARNQANTQTYQGVFSTFKTDPLFARLAEEAAAGILQNRIAAYQVNRYGLSESRQQQHDQAMFIMGMVNDIDNSFNMELRAWEAGAQKAIQDAVALGTLKPKDLTDPTKTARILSEYESRTPRPTPEQARDRYLQAHGLTPDRFQKAITAVAPVLLGDEGATGGTKKKGGAPAAPELTPEQVLRRAAAALSAPRTRPDGSKPTAQELVNSLDAYKFTTAQLTRLLNLVRTRSNDPDLIQALTAKINGASNE